MFLAMSLASNIKEPSFDLIKKEDNIEVRLYPEYIVARTSNSGGDEELNNSMFRVLADYIFGGNAKNQEIPMTAPVITKEEDDSYDMIFFMLDVEDETQLPIPDSDKVEIERMNLGKVVTIQFGWWATKSNVSRHRKKIEAYMRRNNLEPISDLMVAQYNSPWMLPPFRKNELLYRIK